MEPRKVQQVNYIYIVVQKRDMPALILR